MLSPTAECVIPYMYMCGWGILCPPVCTCMLVFAVGGFKLLLCLDWLAGGQAVSRHHVLTRLKLRGWCQLKLVLRLSCRHHKQTSMGSTPGRHVFFSFISSVFKYLWFKPKGRSYSICEARDSDHFGTEQYWAIKWNSCLYLLKNSFKKNSLSGRQEAYYETWCRVRWEDWCLLNMKLLLLILT